MKTVAALSNIEPSNCCALHYRPLGSYSKRSKLVAASDLNISPALWQTLDHGACARYSNFFVKDWMPLILTLMQRKKFPTCQFCRDAGKTTVRFIKLFPGSEFSCYDAILLNIEQPGSNTKESYIEKNITFKHWNIKEGSPEPI